MCKRFILLALSAAALVAFAVPAAAQAATVTNVFGEPAETITASSSNMTLTTSSGTLHCNEVELHTKLAVNNTVTAEGYFGTGTASHWGEVHCEVIQLGVNVVTVTEVSPLYTQLAGGGTGFVLLQYVYDVPGPTKCHFESTAKITYTPGTDEIHITGTLAGKKLEGAGNCSSTGSISGDFTVSDEFGFATVIH